MPSHLAPAFPVHVWPPLLCRSRRRLSTETRDRFKTFPAAPSVRPFLHSKQTVPEQDEGSSSLAASVRGPGHRCWQLELLELGGGSLVISPRNLFTLFEKGEREAHAWDDYFWQIYFLQRSRSDFLASNSSSSESSVRPIICISEKFKQPPRKAPQVSPEKSTPRASFCNRKEGEKKPLPWKSTK